MTKKTKTKTKNTQINGEDSIEEQSRCVAFIRDSLGEFSFKLNFERNEERKAGRKHCRKKCMKMTRRELLMGTDVPKGGR